MARVPTIAEEDAKRPNRERDCLVGERTRIVNRIKSTLARLGIRNFKGYSHSFSQQWSHPVSPWPSNVRLEDLEMARTFAIQILLARVAFVNRGNLVLQ
jgi:transposase